MKAAARRIVLPAGPDNARRIGKARPDIDPADSPALAESLREGALRLGHALRDGQVDRLLRYLELLARWNGFYNLTAVREPHRMVSSHLLDCLAALPALNEACHRIGSGQAAPGSPVEVLDVGSGAGLPGLVWAILDVSASPDEASPAPRRYTLIDAVEKKTAFQRQAAGELGLQTVTCVHGRVEDWSGGPFHVVTSRAYSTLKQVVSQTGHLLAPEGCWLALKGAVPHEEIADLPEQVRLDGVCELDVPGLDGAARCVVRLCRR